MFRIFIRLQVMKENRKINQVEKMDTNNNLAKNGLSDCFAKILAWLDSTKKFSAWSDFGLTFIKPKFCTGLKTQRNVKKIESDRKIVFN